MVESVEVAVVGAGAAGLMAALWAGRERHGRGVVVLEGARTLGAKILVSGGGRCNLTHDEVSERDYAGSTPAAIRKVLRRFPVPQTIDFFRELGVELKREAGGKLFPVSDSARTVLAALLAATRAAGAEIRFPRRVETVSRQAAGFLVAGAWGELTARRVILASGGRSLPRSGSDGHGFVLAAELGHSLTPRLLPALVPLTLDASSFILGLAGITLAARLELRSGSGKRLVSFTGSTLLTHFGVSGPPVLDISRHYLAAHAEDPGAHLVMSWLPGETPATVDAELRALGAGSVAGYLRRLLPERLAAALCAEVAVDPATAGHRLTREARRTLVGALVEMRLPVTGHRGFVVAEATAGGVPLAELKLDTLESRVAAGLHFCGEICDVDGRVGGYNFQWAWASGYVAGVAMGQ